MAVVGFVQPPSHSSLHSLALPLTTLIRVTARNSLGFCLQHHGPFQEPSSCLCHPPSLHWTWGERDWQLSSLLDPHLILLSKCTQTPGMWQLLNRAYGAANHPNSQSTFYTFIPLNDDKWRWQQHHYHHAASAMTTSPLPPCNWHCNNIDGSYYHHLAEDTMTGQWHNGVNNSHDHYCPVSSDTLVEQPPTSAAMDGDGDPCCQLALRPSPPSRMSAVNSTSPPPPSHADHHHGTHACRWALSPISPSPPLPSPFRTTSTTTIWWSQWQCAHSTLLSCIYYWHCNLMIYIWLM